jgi:hypothetical protein
VRRIPRKCHPRSLGLNLCFESCDKGFDNQAFFAPLLRSVTIAFKHLVVKIRCQCCTRFLAPLGLTSWPGPLFTLFAILLCMRHGSITRAVPPPPHTHTFSIYSACGVTLIFTSHLLAALPFPLAISPSLLQFCLELRILLV